MGQILGKLKTPNNKIFNETDVVNPDYIAVSGTTLDTTLYDDITSIENWDKYGELACTDYFQIRDNIIDIMTDLRWSGLTSNEKYIAIKYYAREKDVDINTSDTDKVMFLMGEGYSYDDAVAYVKKSYVIHREKLIESCMSRANSHKLIEVVSTYLDLNDASDLINVTYKLFELYKTQAIFGISGGDGQEGIFDFVLSYPGTSFEFSGLEQQNYTLKTGTWDDFKTDIMSIIKYGIY
jgi:hypothetical protein